MSLTQPLSRRRYSANTQGEPSNAFRSILLSNAERARDWSVTSMVWRKSVVSSSLLEQSSLTALSVMSGALAASAYRDVVPCTLFATVSYTHLTLPTKA